MTMAELYVAQEKLDGGAAMVETIKAEVGKLNVESKQQREAKEKAAKTEATEAPKKTVKKAAAKKPAAKKTVKKSAK